VDQVRYPNYRHAKPLTVTLEPGDALFVPALWWHEVVSEVGEDGLNIAVNYWYKAHSEGLLDAYGALREQLAE
jgi:jumonji domain-containing protein 7